MAVAARKPQASTPSDDLVIDFSLELEDVSFEVHQRTFLIVSDEMSIDDVQLFMGLAEFFSIDDEITISDTLFHFYLINIEYNDSIDIEVYQNFTEQLIPVQESDVVDDTDAVGRLNSLELDLVMFSTNPSFFKEFNYSDGSLLGYSLYNNVNKDVLLATVVFGFSGEDLITKTIHRESDNKNLLITFSYLDGNLVSQTRMIF